MSVQTTITAEPPIGAPGMIYDSGAWHDIVSLVCSEDIAFGSGVRISDMYCELPDNSGEVTGEFGVAIHDPTKATGAGYKAGDVAQVMKRGRVFVTTEEAIASNATPYCRFTANTGPTRPQGGWLNGADSGKAAQPGGVRVFRGNAAAGLAVLELGGATGPTGPQGATGATGPTGPTGP